MGRVLKVLAAAIGSVLGLLLLAAAIVFVTFDINDWKSRLAERATATLGREVAIEGPLDIAWDWTPMITVEGLTIANAGWAEAPHLAKVGKLQASIDLWQQLQGRTVLPEVTLIEPDLFLEQREDGEVNWTFGEKNAEDGVATDVAEEVVVPDDRTEFPVIGELTIGDGAFAFVDAARSLDLEGSIDTVAGEGGGGDEVEISGEGKFEGEAFGVVLEAGPLTRLREPEIPYPVDLTVTLGDTEAAIKGTLTRPLELAGVDLNLTLSGPNLADVFPITGIPLPPTPPYRLTGDLVRAGGLWRFVDFDGRLGDSDLRGVIQIDLTEDPLRFDADLITDKLDFDDLAGFIGAPTEEGEQDAEADNIIPDTEINLDRLQAANGKAKLRARTILAPDLPIDDLDAELNLEDGVLRLEPAGFGVADGTVNLWISLYGAQDPVQIDMLTRIRDVRLKEAFKGSGFARETGGKIDGRIELSGRGNSLHEMLDTAEGTSFLVMSDGDISALLLEAVSLDAAEALGLYIGEDTNVPLNCLATDLEIADGVARTKLGVLDTADSVIELGGDIDLGEERLDLIVTPHPKDVSLLNLRSKVHVEGEFTDPSISLDAGSILKFVPLVDLGLAEDAPCKSLLARARDDSS